MVQQSAVTLKTVATADETRVYARVASGVILELLQSSINPTKLFHPALHWTDVTGQPVQVGWTQTASGFAPPVVASAVASVMPSVAELQAEIKLLSAKIAALPPATTP